jgi:hypothetical protein
LLAEFNVAKRTEAAESTEIPSPGFFVSYRPELNAFVAIDLQDAQVGSH